VTATADFDDLIGRLRGLVIALSTVFSRDEAGEVEEFIEHAEFGEALRTITWIIVEENKQIAMADLAEIQSLAQRMEMTTEQPEELPGHVADVE